VDIESLLRSSNEHSVEYVLIGASAFPVHGYARATLDVDIFIRPTPENARRTHAALTAFGYDLQSTPIYCVRTDPVARVRRSERAWTIRMLSTGAGS